jgi:alternate signal-mediated exported protein
MNKATKGAIAAGAAGILLLGGAGTFALWSETAAISAGNVSTGELSLALTDTAGVWTHEGGVTPVTVAGIVPGDVVTSTQQAVITASGDNIAGKFEVGTVSGALPIGVTASVTTVETEDDLTGTGSLLSFATAGEYSVDVVITLTFNTTGTTSQLEAINPDDLTLTLTLVRPAA